MQPSILDNKIKSLLICHDGAELNCIGIARWLVFFTDLVGIIILRESRKRKYKRIKYEIKRVGLFRFFDVILFRLFYKIFLSKKDQKKEKILIKSLVQKYPEISKGTHTLFTHSPNSIDAEKFINELSPDIIIARCKTLLKKKIFSIAKVGTFVMHPGICPEYRNAHGCFWALANNDLNKVGMTLLKIDEGIDTGPVYAYYNYDFNEINESHIIIQDRVVLENLDEIKNKILDICSGNAHSINTKGRKSGVWGQPWLSKYIMWKIKARLRNN